MTKEEKRGVGLELQKQPGTRLTLLTLDVVSSVTAQGLCLDCPELKTNKASVCGLSSSRALHHMVRKSTCFYLNVNLDFMFHNFFFNQSLVDNVLFLISVS